MAGKDLGEVFSSDSAELFQRARPEVLLLETQRTLKNKTLHFGNLKSLGHSGSGWGVSIIQLLNQQHKHPKMQWPERIPQLYIRLEAIAIRVEAIASRLEAIPRH